MKKGRYGLIKRVIWGVYAFWGVLFFSNAEVPDWVLISRENGGIAAFDAGSNKKLFSDAKPWVYWYWMNGNVSCEGITQDLEAMAEVGIGGAYLFPISQESGEEYTKIDPPVHSPSDLWWDMVIHSAREAKRLGMKLAMNCCDGWATAGGPWITPELSMQKVLWTTMIVEGGTPFTGKIEQPANTGSRKSKVSAEYANYYRDIAVLAYPAPSGWKRPVDEKNLKSAFRIAQLDGKSGLFWKRNREMFPWITDTEAPENSCVAMDKIVDLTDKVKADGTLSWNPPAGEWIVQRFVYATTGAENHPVGGGAVGLECDKFNPEAARIQFENWFGAALKKVGPELAVKTLWMNHTDSWECGSQNWSPVFLAEFKKRRGYDPVKYLPCLSGIPVGSADLSERFLYDIRRTISDLVSDAYFKTMRDLTNQKGAFFSAECIGDVFVADALQPYRDVDFAMGEFWHGAGWLKGLFVHTEDAVSGGHIYGKRIIQAEAFTQYRVRWIEDPYFLKPLGDFAFSIGVNRFVLHVWPHQAFPGKVPGVTLGGKYGTCFGGNQTWHSQGKAWFDYLRRCQALLQRGLPVADVCYFIGEDIPCRSILREDLNPALSAGYDYDCINRDALLTRAQAKDGKIVLPDGVSYNLLVLPEIRPAGAGPSISGGTSSTSSVVYRMTPDLAKKIGELAQAGVKIIGPKPDRSYSLTGYPECDDEVKQIVEKSWEKVKSGVTPDVTLKQMGLDHDVEFIGADMTHKSRGVMKYSSPPFCWNHRRTEDEDIYFVANQEREEKSVDVAFRITGRQPELWHPETGKMRNLTDWEVKDGRTYIPLKFEPAESYFVVFRREEQRGKGQEEAPSSGGVSASLRGKNFPELEEVLKIDGEWDVEFQKGRGAPEKIKLPNLISLDQYSDFGVKHFSGTATYRKTFNLSEFRVSSFQFPVYLDLGNVKNLAGVTLNGKDLGVVWKPPFRIDITDALKDGENTLEVKVTNTWKNRLIGDVVAPEKRVTWTLFKDNEWFKPNTPLEQAGLIGPVTLQKTKVREKEIHQGIRSH